MKEMLHPDDFPDPPRGPALLHVQDDVDWIAQWRATGCRSALDRLLRTHSGRVRAMARAWSRRPALEDDLVSEGMLALIRCLDGYAPRPGVPFFAYARPFVRAAMRQAFYREASIITMPMHHIRALREGKATALDEVLFRAATSPDRLDTPDAPDLGAECETGEVALIRSEVERIRETALAGALAALSETDRLIMERRRDGEPGKVSDLARHLGITPARAAQIEARALGRLRTQLIRRGFSPTNAGCGR